MPGLVPGIHVLTALKQENVDGRDKPGHDVSESHLNENGKAIARG
jgi:hypothetical protein